MSMSENDDKSPDLSEKSWRDYVLPDAKDVMIKTRILLRDSVTERLIGCEVDAILEYIQRLVVTVSKDPQDDSRKDDEKWKADLMIDQFVLPYRSFVKYDASLIEMKCTPHEQVETIPKSAQDDPYYLDYPLCLVLVGENARLEAARRLRDLDKPDSGRKCVFEIISGKVHYELKEKLFGYDAS